MSATACVHKLFEQQVENSPERTALVQGDERMSYSELNARSNQIAHFLLSSGVTSESLVGVAIERSFDLIAVVIGILKAGAAYLPLDPCEPSARLSTIIEDAKASLVLTTSSKADDLRFGIHQVACVDELKLNEFDARNPSIPSKPTDLAYVMFTSGSTGRPKGVMVEHRSIARLVNETDYADFDVANVFLHFAPITFDASTFEIWGALLNGARLVIMPEGTTSLDELGKVIKEEGVTTLWLTAGLFHLMVDERIEALRPLRQLLAGGDVLSVPHVQRVLDTLDCDVINGYGPTENTTFTCTFKVPRNTKLGKSIPIGKPISKTDVIILDENLEQVNDGEAGELYIGGEGLSRGYLNNDEMTAERFIANPFPQIASERLYRSGDLVRVLDDGNIEFLGRADRQIKIRGFRIELEEIENALTRQSGVREAITVARNVPGSEKELAAFVVLDRDRRTTPPEIRDGIASALPDYMIPSSINVVHAMPLTTNGKVDRDALIGMIERRNGHGAVTIAPKTGRERRLAEILEEILAGGQVGANDNFFDLGASSLQLAKFHSRLQIEIDPEIKIVSLFQNPTVSSLARSIGPEVETGTTSSGVLDRAARQRGAFASRKQIKKGEGRL